jgi:pyrroloquinoline quinone (PQQ) biosynthesis protein C
VTKPYLRTEVNRANPFLAHTRDGSSSVILLDRFELPMADIPSSLWTKIEASLDVGFLGPVIEPDVMIVLMSEQYAAASEFVYGHPVWGRIRSGDRNALHAYLLETRHYLAAASARMSPSIARQIGLGPVNLLLSRHLLEEWDHAKFFADALQAIGCRRDLLPAVRPLPATMEWLHATRTLAYGSGLNAAMCSGFMEYSSTEADAVAGWHDMLVSSGLLLPEANRAILRHVDTDVAFGHADNWKHVLTARGPLVPDEAAGALNAVATLAEAIYRWLSSLDRGLSASIVAGLQLLEEDRVEAAGSGSARTSEAQTETAGPQDIEVAIYDGLPVWPAPVLSLVSWGDEGLTDAAAIITGLTYALGSLPADEPSPLQSAVRTNAARLVGSGAVQRDTVQGLEAEATGWLRAIDGHELWSAMVEDSSDELIVGYVLENYHYLASATCHIGAAIASSTSAAVRRQLIAHLEDELTHCTMLEKTLLQCGGVERPSAMRPLPTTVAFVGFLENLGHQDWKAYLAVSTFLQKSLSECRPTSRHTQFYSAIADRSPTGAALLRALWEHDEIDEGLGHDDRPAQRLAELLRYGPLPEDSLRHAAVGPGLAWGFLDGILQHYRTGPGSVRQRVAWRG